MTFFFLHILAPPYLLIYLVAWESLLAGRPCNILINWEPIVKNKRFINLINSKGICRFHSLLVSPYIYYLYIIYVIILIVTYIY